MRITLKRVINTDPVRQILIVPIFEDNMCLLKIEGNKLHVLLIIHLWRIQLIKKNHTHRYIISKKQHQLSECYLESSYTV